jgi:predicted methyltransferase
MEITADGYSDAVEDISKICGSMSYQPRLTSTSELHSWRYLVIYKVDKKKGGKILRYVGYPGQRIK